MSLGSHLYVHGLRLVMVLALMRSAFAAETIVINEIMYHSKETEWKEDTSAEFLELYHAGDAPLSVENWKFTSGIRFAFPAMTVKPGEFVVIAADPTAFRKRYPEVTDVLGPYRGRLSNGSDKLVLEDADEREIDAVQFADSGRWANRVSSRLKGYEDWVWQAGHDGGGKSLSLKSPRAKNEYGDHWTSSVADGGTPGRQNDVITEEVPPVIVSVQHEPMIPKGDESVVVSAKVDPADEVTLTLHYRVDGKKTFEVVPMENGQGVLPEMPDKTVVQFYVQAVDAAGLQTEYPPLHRDDTGKVTERQAVCLYQVDDTFDREAEQAPGAKPTYRLISTAKEMAMLKELAGMSGRESVYDNHLHLTFIVVDGNDVQVHYNVTCRIRGHGSRSAFPPGLRVSFPSDAPWRGLTDINLNTQYTQSQSIGAAIHQMAGSMSAASTPVRVLMNGVNWAKKGSPQFGCYVHNEVLDSAFVERNYPGEEDGNLYRLVARAYLNENKSTIANLRPIYSKRNHGSEDDYSDIIQLIQTLGQASPADTYFERVNKIADLEQWAHFIALDALLCNTEGGMSSGRGDDVALFRRADGRFEFIPYDLDSIMGMGDDGQRVDMSVFGYGNMSGLRALFLDPRFRKLYTDTIVRLTETVYTPANIHRLIDEQWSGWIPKNEIQKVKDFVGQRIANVLSQIQSATFVASTLETEGEFYKASSAKFALYGRFDQRSVTDVFVGDRRTKVFKDTGMWIVPPNQLGEWVRPGMNTIPVIMRNAEGDVVEEQRLRVWLDNGEVKRLTGALPNDKVTEWLAKEGPYLVEGDFVIPEGSSLLVGEGSTVYMGGGSRFIVYGDLVVQGGPSARVTFVSDPSDKDSQGWAGMQIGGMGQGLVAMKYVDLLDIQGGIEVSGRELSLDHVTLLGSKDFAIRLDQGHLSVHESQLTQGGADQPIIISNGEVNMVRSSITRDGAGVGLEISSPGMRVFGCTFTQPAAPVLKGQDGFVEGNDFVVSGDASGDVIEVVSGGNVRVLRNRVTGKAALPLADGNEQVQGALSERELPEVDIRIVEQPRPQSASTSARFVIAGHGLASFIYQLDDEPWSEPILLNGANLHEFSVNVGPGQHVVKVIGRHVWNNLLVSDPVASRAFEMIPDLPPILISEVLAVNETAHQIGGEFVDYIELQNVGTEDFDVGGYSLSDDPEKLAEYTFPSGTIIPAGGYHLVAATKEVMGFALGGDGDAVYLSRNDRVVDSVMFGFQLPDCSISRLENNHWGLSSPTPLAPNAAVPLAEATSLRFCEWFAAPDRRSPDEFIELKNRSTLPVDLGGVTITDRVPNKNVWKSLPPLSFLAGEGIRVFYTDGSPKKGADHLDFRLSDDGESIGLFAGDGTMIDFVSYGPQSVGYSQGRAEDGSLKFGRPSPGLLEEEIVSDNPLVAGIRISEVNYHPSASDDEEYLELVNISNAVVSLDGLRFVSGIEHDFEDMQLGPQARAVVVKDRQAFRKRYGEDVVIVGQYDGKLSNSGERIALATEDGQTVVEFEYNDKWYKDTDGKGYSLEVKDVLSEQVASKKAWKPSDQLGGSPGK